MHHRRWAGGYIRHRASGVTAFLNFRRRIAGKAAAFAEALRPEFKSYIQTVVSNARILSATLMDRGVAIVSGGTDTHVALVDLRPKGLTGNITEVSLENAGITCNKNGIPFDPQPPPVTSGVRLGTPAGTTRGFGNEEFVKIGLEEFFLLGFSTFILLVDNDINKVVHRDISRGF